MLKLSVCGFFYVSEAVHIIDVIVSVVVMNYHECVGRWNGVDSVE